MKLYCATVLAVPMLLLTSCAHHQIAAARPSYIPSINKEIINAVNAGDGDYELRRLRAQIDAKPQNLTVRLELARHYQQLGFPEIALEHLRLACERAPDSDDAHLALAKFLRDSDRAREAATMLTIYTGIHAQPSAGVWAWLGLLQDDLEDWQAGESAHRKSLALDAGRDEFHNNLGYCLLRQGKPQDAAAEFRIALKLHPHSEIAENNLGLALAVLDSQADSKDAVAHLQSVADPATAHNNMAVALLEAGKYPEAQKEIAVALGYNQSHPAALSNLQLLSTLQGHPADSTVELPAGVPGRLQPEGRRARIVGIWHRIWAGAVQAGAVHNSSTHDSSETNDSGSPVASR